MAAIKDVDRLMGRRHGQFRIVAGMVNKIKKKTISQGRSQAFNQTRICRVEGSAPKYNPGG